MAATGKRPKYRGTVLHGFVFGHYDSRGGTVFIEGADLEVAKRRFVEALFAGDHRVEDWGRSELDKLILKQAQDDFMFKADLFVPSHFAIPEAQEGGPYMDLEEEGKVLEPFNPRNQRGPQEFTSWAGAKRTVLLEFVPKGEDPRLFQKNARWPRWEDDAFGFVVLRQNRSRGR